MTSPTSRFVLAAVLATGAAVAVVSAERIQSAPTAPTLVQTSEEQRAAYLASAEIWRAGGIPTPDQVREGPPGRNPLRGVPRNTAGEVECAWHRGGAGASGRTAKFTCRTASGRIVRVKYYDGDVRNGNREVFAEVAATRLFWALGFDADPMYPIAVRCLDCPADPMTGTGPRASRRYLGVVEGFYEGTILGSTGDLNQGWRFGELAAAIGARPADQARSQQQMYFDALSLLAVFVQHGDRKGSQQRLVCTTALDFDPADVHPVDDDAGFMLPVLFEPPSATTCAATRVTIQDLGATFGRADQFTYNRSAKMHLSSWASVPVFRMRTINRRHPTDVPACHGALTASRSAGPGPEENPRISEAGRRFLHERLTSLSSDHVRAIFETARVTELDEPHVWRDPSTRQTVEGVEAWMAVFQHKVDEIGQVECPN